MGLRLGSQVPPGPSRVFPDYVVGGVLGGGESWGRTGVPSTLALMVPPLLPLHSATPRAVPAGDR